MRQIDAAAYQFAQEFDGLAGSQINFADLLTRQRG
jgi:hypothetical protein